MKTNAGAAAEPSDAQIMALWRECSIPTDENDHTTGPLPFARAVLALTSAPAEPWPTTATPEMIEAFKLNYKEGSIWTDRLTRAIEAMLEVAPRAPAQTPQAADAIDAREQDFDVFDEHDIELSSKQVREIEALAPREEAPPAAQPPTPWVSVSISEEFMTVDNYDARGVPNGRYRLTAPPAAGAAQAVAAIEFALATDEGLEFLRVWQHGDWWTIRKEWPEAPASVFVSP